MGTESIISHYARDIKVQLLSGHFATKHSHVNYFIDLTYAKTRHKMAKEIAAELSDRYLSVNIDTIICHEGTEMIGAFMADALSQRGMMMVNGDTEINVATPELNTDGHMIFRDNTIDMVKDKEVLLLISSMSTGQTVNRAMECLKYYGGNLSGICALFSIVPEIYGHTVNAIFTNEDINDYRSYTPENCELCAANRKLDAIVNTFGYSRL